MLRFEDYVARRKKEDRLNEFDVDARNENLRTCVNYAFEYFNNYLDITAAENKTVSQNEKIEKYRKQLQEYEPDVRDWLLGINSEYGGYLNRTIGKILEQNEFFFLLHTDSEFRSISYDCYSKLIKKYPFLKDQTEMLFLFIKNYHRIRSQTARRLEFPFISEGINTWVEDTWNKHQVNLVAFAENWVQYFYDHEDTWPATHRRKSQDPGIKYDYDVKQGGNLFNLNSLYVKMPKKSFTRRRKQEFEILMMYFWLRQIVGDDEGYWQKYLEEVLPSLEKV